MPRASLLLRVRWRPVIMFVCVCMEYGSRISVYVVTLQPDSECFIRGVGVILVLSINDSVPYSLFVPVLFIVVPNTTLIFT